MSHRRICVQAALAAALLILVGGLRPAAAGGAYSVGLYSMSCGARMDYCVPICDATVPGGFALGRCYDRCSIDAGICQASRIPVPGRRSRR